MPTLSDHRALLLGGAAAVAYGLFLFALLPAGVTPLGDDFGYYRSVVETLQRGRPWTDGWLEPWAASLSGLSAVVYGLTGSFTAAIHGVQAAAAAALVLTVALLRERGHPSSGAAWVAIAFLTLPTLLWKQLEFTGVVLYWPCLLGALWAAGRKRWGVFLLSWSVAVATRQSAVAWMLIPALALIWPDREDTKRSRPWLAPLSVLAAGGLFFFLLHLGMNKTHAQTVVTDRLWEHFSLGQAFVTAGVGVGTFAVAAGVAAAWLRLSGVLPKVNGPRLGVMAVVVIGVLVLVGLFDPRTVMKFEHASYTGVVGRWYLAGLAAMAAAGWTAGGFTLRPKPAVYAAGSLLLLALRADLWDYYLADIMIFGLMAVAVEPGKRARLGWICGLPRLALLLALLAFHGWSALRLKLRLDQAHATTVVMERAFRRGDVAPHQFYGAPFGYVAWHLQPYFMAHEGKDDPKLAGFWNYLLYSINFRTEYLGRLGTLKPFRDEPPPDPGRFIESGEFPVLWWGRMRVTLERATLLPNPPPYVPMRLEEYHRIPFPLDDREWRALVDGDRL